MKMYFSEELDSVLRYARDEAMRTGHTIILPDHFILGMIRANGSGAAICLDALGVDIRELKRSLDKLLMKESPVSWENMYDIRLSAEAQDAVNAALLESQLCGAELCGSIHLLIAILKAETGEGGRILSDSGISHSSVKEEADRRNMLGDPGKSLKAMPAASEIADELEREIIGAILASAPGSPIVS